VALDVGERRRAAGGSGVAARPRDRRVHARRRPPRRRRPGAPRPPGPADRGAAGRVAGTGHSARADRVGAPRYLASGSGRSWNRIALLVVPCPPSMWNGVRVLTDAQSPRPFQPAVGSSIRPSSTWCRTPWGRGPAGPPTSRP
jgi:hypothetical protein